MIALCTGPEQKTAPELTTCFTLLLRRLGPPQVDVLIVAWFENGTDLFAEMRLNGRVLRLPTFDRPVAVSLDFVTSGLPALMEEAGFVRVERVRVPLH